MADPNDSSERSGRDRVATLIEAVEIPRDSSTGPPLASRRADVDPVPRVGRHVGIIDYPT
jgi:hypothetical protein